ncbi:MAG: hypothetical protein ACXVJW_03925 [Acidimicrobiia bacterium]
MTVDFPGPFEHHDVVVNGWRIPFLEATPLNGGRIALSLDRRTSIDMTVEEADRLLPFIADCIAVSMGYTAHPGCDGLDEPRPSHPMARMHAV